MRITSLAAIAALTLSGLWGGDASAQIYGNGYGTVPSGSYQQSCTNARVRGNVLFASCMNNNGQRVRTQIPVGQCGRSDIGNINGQLSCVRSDYGYGGNGRGRRGYGRGGRFGRNYSGSLPNGSYTQSCQNASMNGSTLTAQCRNNGGGWNTSYLDISRCNTNDDIGNVNGQLRCVYRGY